MRPIEPKIVMPRTAKVGDIIQIKTKIRHPMETGWRKDGEGQTVARNLLTKFTCSFEGQTVLAGDYSTGVSEDPYLMFYAKVTKAGTYNFKWVGDNDQVYETSVVLEIAKPGQTS